MTDKNKLATIEPDYTERSDRAALKVEHRLVREGGEEFEKSCDAMREAGRQLIAGVVHMRSAGLKFIAARDKQLTFDEHTIGWFRSVEELLPAGFSLQKMEYAVKVARALPEKPRTIEDCRPVMQTCLIASGQLVMPERSEAQASHERVLFNEATRSFLHLGQLLEKLSKEEPMSQWGRPKLEMFVRNGRPLVDDVLKAEQLLKD